LLTDSATETTVSLSVPYAAYLLAEHLGVSGVLAVLAAGLYLRSGVAHRALSSRGWLEGRTVWRYADFAITSGAFALLGFELAQVLRHDENRSPSLGLAGVVLLTVIVLRAIWVFPAAAVLRRRRGEDAGHGWRESTIVAWCGMRGVVTVATALALPMRTHGGVPFPHRSDVVLTALGVVLVTLVFQGLTLSPLVRRLGVEGDEDCAVEVERLRRGAARAAKDRLRDLRSKTDEPEAFKAIRDGYEDAHRSREAFRQAGAAAPEVLREALEEALDAERELVLEARRRGDTSTQAADLVLTEIESRALRSTETEAANDVPEDGDA
jgi:CPA1 family monovalent cation:H+ antiporter